MTDSPIPSTPLITTEIPRPRSRELLERGTRVLYKGLADYLAPLVMDRKSAYTVTDIDGNVFFDLASASAAVPIGAARPDLIDPAVEAIRRFGNEDSHTLATPDMFELAERLVALAPDSINRVDIALNGTEAVETAIRLMRRASGRPIVLGFHGSYHGESTATASLGAEIPKRSICGLFRSVPSILLKRVAFFPPPTVRLGDASSRHPRDDCSRRRAVRRVACGNRL